MHEFIMCNAAIFFGMLAIASIPAYIVAVILECFGKISPIVKADIILSGLIYMAISFTLCWKLNCLAF